MQKEELEEKEIKNREVLTQVLLKDRRMERKNTLTRISKWVKG
jgi:hypothetical protein